MCVRLIALCVLLCGALLMGSCGAAQVCKGGISNLTLNPQGSPCESTCDCSNQKYEGVCVQGVCDSRKREPCTNVGEERECDLLASARIGACTQGTWGCKPDHLNEALWGDCTLKKVPETGSLCTDGKDNDCDGKVDTTDEDCPQTCTPGATISCGFCKSGQQRCGADRRWGACQGERASSEESCNEIDDDCDGKVDNDGDKELQRSCYPDGTSGCVLQSDGSYKCEGACKAGTQRCVKGDWSECKGFVSVTKESCNGADDDCDGKVDNDGDKELQRSCYPDGTSGCVLQSDGSYKCEGACKAGTQRCAQGKWEGMCDAPSLPKEKRCESKDNDCDGQLDDDAETCTRWAVSLVGEARDSGKLDGLWMEHASMQIDAKGNLFAVGGFAGEQKAGSFDLKSATDAVRSAFVARLGGSGKVTWAQALTGEKSSVTGAQIALSSAGDLHMVGALDGSLDVAGQTLQSSASDLLFLGVNAADGKVNWSSLVVALGPQSGLTLAAEPGGGFVAGGVYNGSLKLGSVSLTGSASTNSDAWFARLNDKQEVQWVNTIVGSGSIELRALCSDGKVLYGVGFYESDSLSVGTAVSLSRPTGSGQASFVFKADLGNGHILWATRFDSAVGTRAFACSTDATGALYIAGQFKGQSRFEDGGGGVGAVLSSTVAKGTNAPSWDAFVAKVDGAGKIVWARGFGGTGEEVAMGVTVSASGEVAVAGSFQETVVFGGFNLRSQGKHDAFVLKLDGQGKVQRAFAAGGANEDVGRDVVFDKQGNLHVLGYYTGSASFGKTMLVGPHATAFVWSLSIP